MKRFITVFWMFAVLGGPVFAGGEAEVSEEEAFEEIMALEVGTYDDYYYEADPTAYSELFGEKGTYFDPWLDNYHEDEAVKESLIAWKGTTVYTRSGDSWQKVHAHWSTSTPVPEGL